jgi:hypothetical protein
MQTKIKLACLAAFALSALIFSAAVFIREVSFIVTLIFAE